MDPFKFRGTQATQAPIENLSIDMLFRFFCVSGTAGLGASGVASGAGSGVGSGSGSGAGSGVGNDRPQRWGPSRVHP